MDKEKENPEVRFSGFAESWKKFKLGDIGYPYTGLSGKTKKDFGHGEGRYITYLNVFSNPISNLNSVGEIGIDPMQNEVKKGDILFTVSSETPEDVGMSSVWTENLNNVYLNSFCFGYRPTTKINYYFIANLLRTPTFRNKIKVLAQGISRYNISKNKVMELHVNLPNIDEQKKIGDYLRNFDKLISEHQKKQTNLKALKKAMLDKIFPKKGQTVPEIRFKGFKGNWENFKLGNIGNPYTGLSGKTKSDFGHGKGRYITYMNVFSNPISDINAIDKIEIDSTQNEVITGDVLFTVSSETSAEVGMSSVWTGNEKNVYLNSFCFGYRPKIKLDNYFLANILRTKTFRDQMILLAQGISRYNISKNKVMHLKISLPEFDEQVVIGEYFKNLDDLITQHNTQIEKLNNLKKAFLAKMFI
ncbi:MULTISPECIES: restriction endonuclease subunit S [unclassified Chryseobacterium]|uniref:restriction endonuclease subunit S n=1 Tax=unclassified Chryseobacterium TaxID=2593645 RepID=UPI000D349E19|nr:MULTISPECIES: restriction endonuclease subunit S [unclassified Chryseobacterium]PTT66909.1 restriction endonuclease subunit S [Chryseobacterium sp. HMWF001]PVV57220.1 restriction endonuclease subunit S [Chryseobacterium sp. HMWF035]